jgi:hypothetical protein
MKKIIISLILSAFIFTLIVPAKTPVLVELFTSQNCPTCPAAERVLSELESSQPVAGAEIITLAWHVNLWDSFTWKDEFSSPFFTQRQVIYSRSLNIGEIYTPQMFVDGATHFVGSKQDKAAKAVAQATKMPKAEINLSLNADKLSIEIQNLPKRQAATVYLALTEDKLVRRLERGNNAGKTMEYPSVARSLHPVATVDAQAAQFKAETYLQLQPEWKRENLNIIVFVQENVSRRIIAVKRLEAKI